MYLIYNNNNIYIINYVENILSWLFSTYSRVRKDFVKEEGASLFIFLVLLGSVTNCIDRIIDIFSDCLHGFCCIIGDGFYCICRIIRNCFH